MVYSHIYKRIIDSIRKDIFSGVIPPGAALPSMRSMSQQWHCTTGTILHAYQELANQGLVISHVGQGTRVADPLPRQNLTPLRQAALINRAETFLLDIMTAGFEPDEVEQSLRMALDRWRISPEDADPIPSNVLRFVGSHDPAVAMISAGFAEICPGHSLQLSFVGSLGGLIALAEKKADLAGSHLWDDASDTYNEPYISKLLPGQSVVLLTLAQRRVGLIVQPGNPFGVRTLADIPRSGARFVNRQSGSGTRVWLDAQLQRAGISPKTIHGYHNEKLTHTAVARTISKGHSDIGLGVETAALATGLEFIQLTTERYDLVIPAENWDQPAIQALASWLRLPQAKITISALGGYDTAETGSVRWCS